MNPIRTRLAAAVLSLAAALAFDAQAAEADEHAGHHPDKAPAAAAPVTPPAADTDMEALRERMRAMREERDPARRMGMMAMQKKDMAAMMDRMHAKGTAGEMGCPMMGDAGRKPAQKGARGKGMGMMGMGTGMGMHGMAERRMEMMDMRMEMMQMMMEQMQQK